MENPSLGGSLVAAPTSDGAQEPSTSLLPPWEYLTPMLNVPSLNRQGRCICSDPASVYYLPEFLPQFCQELWTWKTNCPWLHPRRKKSAAQQSSHGILTFSYSRQASRAVQQLFGILRDRLLDGVPKRILPVIACLGPYIDDFSHQHACDNITRHDLADSITIDQLTRPIVCILSTPVLNLK